MKNKEQKHTTHPTREKTEQPAPNQKSKIGRNGAGVVGQNWTESLDVARKGRYAQENKIQGDDPEREIDTDTSGAV